MLIKYILKTGVFYLEDFKIESDQADTGFITEIRLTKEKHLAKKFNSKEEADDISRIFYINTAINYEVERISDYND